MPAETLHRVRVHVAWLVNLHGKCVRGQPACFREVYMQHIVKHERGRKTKADIQVEAYQ